MKSIVLVLLLAVAGCANWGPAPCHGAGDDYTGADACG